LILFLRVFAIAVTGAALWWSSSSLGLGLGLGELNVTSNLAAPLMASVTLRGLDGIDLDPENFSIRIDSDSKTKIEYRLLRMDADTAVIDLYTRELISEPLFQFRIEVKWESSAVARSYDVLVDPPAYQDLLSADNNSKTSEMEISNSAQTGEQNDQPPVTPRTFLPPVIAVAAGAAGKTAGSTVGSDVDEPRLEYGPTIDGNSIWRVARAVATDNHDLTIYQWMYAIWNANPQAFTGDNMHRLNMGELLSIPLEQEVAATSHTVAWRTYSKQMSLLSTSMPGDNMNAAAPDQSTQPDVALQENAHRVPAQQAVHDVATGLAMFDESELVAAQTREDLALDALIADLEKSASIADAIPVASAGNVLTEVTTQETPQVARSNEVETQLAFGVDDMAETSVVAVRSIDEAGSLAAQTHAGRVVLDSVNAVTAGNHLTAITIGKETAADTTPVSVTRPGVELTGWSAALLSRHEYIDRLPLIGATGSLAFVGRAVQRADKFVATSPSWAALAFGAWVSLVLMMLRQEWLARRARARAAKLRVAELTATDVASTVVCNQPAMQSTGQAAPKSAGAEKPEPVSEVRTEAPLPARPATSNAPGIIAQANAILAQGDIEEAIKLMRLAVELQPHQPDLVVLLLDLYHKTRRTVFFAELLGRSKIALESLAASDQLRLRALYAELCPDLDFPLELDEATDDALPAAEASGGLTASDPEPNIDSQPRLDVDDDAYIETQVIYTGNGVPLLEEATHMPGLVGENIDLDVTLKEADVFLAYGLYDNAEDLLLRGMEVDPERADFLARLLDCYFATRNVVDFVACAEVMLDMGDDASEYWEKVEIMGFELAPYNRMFAGGKDRHLSTQELEIARPETADFDFSEMAENHPTNYNDSEYNDNEIEENSESDLADLDIQEHTADNSAATDVDFDLDANGPVDSSQVQLDDLESYPEPFEELGVAASADGEDEIAIDLEGMNGDLDAALIECLNAVDDEAGAGPGDDADEPVNLDFVIEDVEQLTVDDGIDPGAKTLAAGDDVNLVLVDESTLDSRLDDNLDSSARRILYFPDGSGAGKDIDGFESEVKMTLQAIRDQLQNMTERLFRQERAANDLQQTMAELKDAGGISAGNKGNKSS
jgi:FimV-like protein